MLIIHLSLSAACISPQRSRSVLTGFSVLLLDFVDSSNMLHLSIGERSNDSVYITK